MFVLGASQGGGDEPAAIAVPAAVDTPVSMEVMDVDDHVAINVDAMAGGAAGGAAQTDVPGVVPVTDDACSTPVAARVGAVEVGVKRVRHEPVDGEFHLSRHVDYS